MALTGKKGERETLLLAQMYSAMIFFSYTRTSRIRKIYFDLVMEVIKENHIRILPLQKLVKPVEASACPTMRVPTGA